MHKRLGNCQGDHGVPILHTKVPSQLHPDGDLSDQGERKFCNPSVHLAPDETVGPLGH